MKPSSFRSRSKSLLVASHQTSSHQASRTQETYSERITRDLRAAGRRISEKGVARPMQENQIVGILTEGGGLVDEPVDQPATGGGCPADGELDCKKGFATRDQARAQLFDDIEVFYNRQRRHSSLDYLKSPGF